MSMYVSREKYDKTREQCWQTATKALKVKASDRVCVTVYALEDHKMVRHFMPIACD